MEVSSHGTSLYKSVTAGLFFSLSICFKTTSVSAQSKDDSNRWMTPEKMAPRANPVKQLQNRYNAGRLVFEALHACHGPEACGDGPAANTLNQKPSNLVAMAGMHEDGDVAWKIAEGRGVMPGWKVRLSEEQIWDMVNFIQSLKGAKMEETPKNMKKH